MLNARSKRWSLPGCAARNAACVVLAAGAVAETARATTRTWLNAAGGSAATNTNWSPVGVPNAADDLVFNLAGTYTVTYNATVASVMSHQYRLGTVSLSLSAPHTLGLGVTIGAFSGDNPSVTLLTGDLTTNAIVSLGDVAGAAGTLAISGSDATLTVNGVSSDLAVGRVGTGTLNITGGGFVSVSDDFILGSTSTGNGTATVSGGSGAFPNITTSRLLTTSAAGGDMFVGNIGSGTLNIQSGGFVHSAHDLNVATSAAETGTLNVSGAYSIVQSRLVVDHDLDIGRNDSAGVAGGTASITLNTGANTVTGLTRVGDPDGGTGTLHVLGGSFSTGSMQIASNGEVDMGGGTLNCSAAIANQAGGIIGGAGVINADIANAGAIQPSGTGLTINGILTNTTSNQIVGSKITFGASSGYEGSGTCVADIAGDPTSHITATGTLTIGNSASATGVSYNGSLNVGSSVVTLGDSNGAVLGGLTTFNSGRIECPAGIGVQNLATLRGDGLLVGPLTCSGVLDPDLANAALRGLITVQGNLVMNPTADLRIRIKGTPASQTSDQVQATGTAVFDSTVHVDIDPGVIIQPGQQYILVNATGGRTGTFDSVTPSALCTGVRLVLGYSSTAAILIGAYPDADPTNDGLVDVNDLLSVIAHWGPCGGPGQQSCQFDVDGVSSPGGQFAIDVNDLLEVVGRWGACP